VHVESCAGPAAQSAYGARADGRGPVQANFPPPLTQADGSTHAQVRRNRGGIRPNISNSAWSRLMGRHHPGLIAEQVGGRRAKPRLVSPPGSRRRRWRRRRRRILAPEELKRQCACWWTERDPNGGGRARFLCEIAGARPLGLRGRPPSLRGAERSRGGGAGRRRRIEGQLRRGDPRMADGRHGRPGKTTRRLAGAWPAPPRLIGGDPALAMPELAGTIPGSPASRPKPGQAGVKAVGRWSMNGSAMFSDQAPAKFGGDSRRRRAP